MFSRVRPGLDPHPVTPEVAGCSPVGPAKLSSQDLAFTTKLVSVGGALGVDVLDHLIVTSSSFASLKQRNLM